MLKLQTSAVYSTFGCEVHLRPNVHAIPLCVLHRTCAVKQVHSTLSCTVFLMGNVLGRVVVDEEEVSGAFQRRLFL